MALEERRREAAKRKQEEEDAEARKKACIDPDDAHTAVHENVLAAEHTAAGTDSARSNRLQAALWASQQEWVQPSTEIPDDTRKAVQAVEVKGRAFLWPKISPE